MTDRPIKPGDLVERTGETVTIGLKIIAQGHRYPVADTDERCFLIFDGCDEAAFNPRGFRLVEEE